MSASSKCSHKTSMFHHKFSISDHEGKSPSVHMILDGPTLPSHLIKMLTTANHRNT